MSQPILQVQGLSVGLTDQPEGKIIEHVSFDVPALSIVALVGGSGSGKTTTGLSVLRLLSPALKMDAGKIIFKGQDLSKIGPEEMNAIRGKDIGMVFQDPLQAFNPVFTIGFQVAEVLNCHTALPQHEINTKVLELFEQVGLDDPARVFKSYPHQLSGGMRQRAMIAQAVAAKPALLIADEPTSSLDVTLQARILELFLQLREQYRLSILLITHDLGIVSHMTDYVVVMEKGRVVESGKTKDVIAHAKHPYTQQLMRTLKD